MIINIFGDEYEFLSNFYYSIMEDNDIIYTTNEHYYQSMKCQNEDPMKQRIIKAKGPGEAKRLGQKVELIEDWDKLKCYFMYKGLQLKFKNPVLRKKLIDTGNNILIEGNHHHDNLWGDCFCNNLECSTINGKNWLGNLLMDLREELKS